MRQEGEAKLATAYLPNTRNPSLPVSFWDISYAQEFSTSPWDVRSNMTLRDVSRLQKINKAKKIGSRMASYQDGQAAKRGTNPRSTVGRS